MNKALSFQPPSILIERFCLDHNVSESEARERFEETKKFLVLCATKKDVSYAPSKEVDVMWHEFILNTKSYFVFCDQVGGYLHHIPSEKAEIESYKRTLRDMKQFYGKLNPAFWFEHNACAGVCGHCSSCGSN